VRVRGVCVGRAGPDDHEGLAVRSKSGFGADVGAAPLCLLVDRLSPISMDSPSGTRTPGASAEDGQPIEQVSVECKGEAGLIDGGHVPRLGRVSLAHRGVPLLDERVACHRHVLGVWRQPPEEGVEYRSSRHLARMRDLHTFAGFTVSVMAVRQSGSAQGPMAPPDGHHAGRIRAPPCLPAVRSSRAFRLTPAAT
jgi:hypothetical protein